MGSELNELKDERDSLSNAEFDKNTLAQELGEVKQELGTLETLLKVKYYHSKVSNLMHLGLRYEIVRPK